MGASTAAALIGAVPGIALTVGSRTQESFKEAVRRTSELAGANHRQCDVDDPQSILAVLKGADLVIHTAGPFQQVCSCISQHANRL